MFCFLINFPSKRIFFIKLYLLFQNPLSGKKISFVPSFYFVFRRRNFMYAYFCFKITNYDLTPKYSRVAMLKLLNNFFMLNLYFVIILPLGLMLKVFNRDPLMLKLDKKAQSYWIKRDPTSLSSKKMKKQF